ncbi:hypothetical protein C8F04DRAFT_1201833 [Mycena alexandri]|uniref:Uncharacterized protein n=1 Tax=Mycena alexandri TaxID=1745969 RepID=A0AAD6WKA0_9AGAR|nr:hypothetical protein C8F04DRAFT_1201833 [Mycena alexandri]
MSYTEPSRSQEGGSIVVDQIILFQRTHDGIWQTRRIRMPAHGSYNYVYDPATERDTARLNTIRTNGWKSRFGIDRMAAMFRKGKKQTCATSTPKRLSLPAVYPDEIIIDRFWRRVAGLTTRYHDIHQKWIGGEEIRLWNSTNRYSQACNKCLNSKSKRCIIDEDQASCRTCRDNKVGCDRKPRFVYDMMKHDFFASYEQFLAVFQSREPGRLRRYDKLETRCKRANPVKGRSIGEDQPSEQWRHYNPESFEETTRARTKRRT